MVHKHPDDPRERVDITSGLFSIPASQLKEHEALASKTAAAFSNALSVAEYVYNRPEISEESKLGLHHQKLDLVACANFAWRSVHNHMLMRCSVALNNLSKTIPPIDSDQRVALLHTPFKGTTLFGGELAKIYRANKEHASSVTVYPAAPPQTYSTKPYTGCLLRKVAPPIGRVAGIEIRVDLPLRPNVWRWSGHRDCYCAQDSNKCKVQSNEGAPRAKHLRRGGKSRGDKKQTE